MNIEIRLVETIPRDIYQNIVLFTLERVIFPTGVALGKYDFSRVNKSSYLPYSREINV